MADTTHTLELEVRTKDFASANLKRVGEEGKKAGDQIKEGMSSASGGLRGFTDNWLKLDPDFKKVASAGIGAMSSINAAIATASASSEDLGKAVLGASTSIVAGFASGGPVGGALAAAAAGVGILVNLFGDVDDAASKAASGVAKSARAMADSTNKAIEASRASLAGAEAEESALYGPTFSARTTELKKIEEERKRRTSELLGEIGKEEAKQREIVKLLESKAKLSAEARRENELELVASRERARQARLALDDTQKAARIRRENVDERERQAVAAADRARADAESKRAAAADKVRRSQAEALRDEARRLGLSREQLQILELQQKYMDAARLGEKEAAEAFRKQIQALKEAQGIQAETGKTVETHLDRSIQKTEKLADAAGKAAKALGAAGKAPKEAREPQARPEKGAPEARGEAAGADGEPDLFPEGSLASARQRRRDLLRLRKRQRAAGARNAFVGGRIPGMRSGRRPGGLGAFSGLFTPRPGGGAEAGDLMGPDEAGSLGVGGLQGVGMDGLPVPAPAPAAVGPGGGPPKSPGAITPSANAAAAALEAQTSALKQVAEQIDAMKKSADEGKAAAEGAKTGSDAAASSLQDVAAGLSAVADNMAAAASSAQGLSTTVNQLKADVQRLKDAVNLRGGN